MRKFAKSIGSEGKRFGQPGEQVPFCRLPTNVLLVLGFGLVHTVIDRFLCNCWRLLARGGVPFLSFAGGGWESKHHLPVAPRSFFSLTGKCAVLSCGFLNERRVSCIFLLEVLSPLRSPALCCEGRKRLPTQNCLRRGIQLYN